MIARAEVVEFVIGNVRELVDTWEADGVSEATALIGEMNWQSLNIVVLANAIQERYGQTFPFAALMQELGDGQRVDLTVGELVDFVYENLRPVSDVRERGEASGGKTL